MTDTPKELGFYMPAEWEPHRAIWLAWPYDNTTFPNRVHSVEKIYCQIIAQISKSEHVNVLVKDDDMHARVSGMLLDSNINLDTVTLIVISYTDVWVRDYAPLFLLQKNTNKKVLSKWRYNGYGKAEDPFFTELCKDNEVFLNLRERLGYEIFEQDMVLEGGSIEVNGKGTLITTKQCLLNPNRNILLSKEQIEHQLKQSLGVTHIIWLDEGLINDHTDGHIDDIVKFVSPTVVLCAYEEDHTHPNFSILHKNYLDLCGAKDQDGNPFTVVKVPMPHMKYDTGEIAPVSYLNFYIGTTVVLVPTFNDSNDAPALHLVQSFFPTRDVIGIDCRDIIYGGGTIHCISMQEPL